MKGLTYVPFGKLRAGMAESKKRGGGPKTPEGKARSSENSTTHGMRAKHVRVLADERPEEYKRHFEGWMDQLEPQNFLEEQLARQVISNSWLMERATRRAMENEGAVAGDEDTQHAADWSAAQEHKLELMQRYKTSAERAFYRSLEAYRRNRNDDMKDKLAVIKLTRENEELRAREKAREESRECQPQASAKPKKKEKLAVIEQWADISTNAAGKTVTKLVPSNEELQKAGFEDGAHTGSGVPAAVFCGGGAGRIPLDDERSADAGVWRVGGAADDLGGVETADCARDGSDGRPLAALCEHAAAARARWVRVQGVYGESMDAGGGGFGVSSLAIWGWDELGTGLEKARRRGE